MNLNIKLKLIGYYSNENQNMQPEKRFIEEAKQLNDLLEQSFQLTFANHSESNELNDDFIASLSRNSVYILKDTDKNLYAWFKQKQIARISHVVYDKTIKPIPVAYQSWFLLGEAIPKNEGKVAHLKQKANNEVTLFDLYDIKHTYHESEFAVNTTNGDFLLVLNKKVYAVNWSKYEHISIKELRALVLHDWTYLQEVSTQDLCDETNCVGWDYSNCDMNRCRGNCDGCGGRRNICDKRCFYNRYNTCVKICTFANAGAEEIGSATEIIKKITIPFSDHIQLLNTHSDMLQSLYNKCNSYRFPFDASTSYCETYNQMLIKEQHRAMPQDAFADITITRADKIEHYKLLKSSITIENPGCLFFFASKYLSIGGYNQLTDSYISQQNIDIKFDQGYDSQSFYDHINKRDYNALSITVVNMKIQYQFK